MRHAKTVSSFPGLPRDLLCTSGAEILFYRFFSFPRFPFPFLFPPLSPVIYFSFFSIPVSLLLLFLTIWTECLLSASWKGGRLVDFYPFVSVLSVSCALNSIDPHVLPEYIVGR